MKNTATNTTLYLSNLSYKRDRNGLKSLLSPFGKIKNIKIIVEPKTNQSRGMAFVEMDKRLDAETIITELDGTVIDRRTLKVNWAIPQIDSLPKNTDDEKGAPKKKNKDLAFKDIQLAKKARNDEKRKSNPFTYKAKTIKKV